MSELVTRVLDGDWPMRPVLGEGQGPRPVQNGGYPVTPADQVKDVNEAPHRVADHAGELHPVRVRDGRQVADSGHAALIAIRKGLRAGLARQPRADQLADV